MFLLSTQNLVCKYLYLLQLLFIKFGDCFLLPVFLRNCAMLYKLKPLVLLNARSRRSVTGRSHTRNREVEHVHGHVTAIDGVIMADRVTDPARKVGHAREVAHVKEAAHVTEIVTVLVGVTGIDTRVTAEAGVVNVTAIGESVTLTVTTRSERGSPLRDWGELVQCVYSSF